MVKKKAADCETHYGYSWYTEEQLEDYYNDLIGNFSNIFSISKLIFCL